MTSVEPRATAAGRMRRALLPAVRIVFSVAVIGAVGYATVQQWADVRDTVTSLPWPSLALSLVMVLAGLGAQTMAYRAALRDVGHRVSVRTTSQIFLIGLLAKYLPGSIWAFVLQMELGRRANLQRARVLVATLLAVGLGTATAFLFGVFGLPVLFEIDRAISVAVVLLVPVALFCSHPRVLTWLVNRFLRIARRPPLTEPITWAGVGAVAAWSSVGWVCFGVHLWLLANAGAAPGLSGVTRCIAALALGLTAGMLAFLSPSGLGVREAIITAALLPYVPAGTALGMALASRLIFTVAEVIAAAAAAGTGLSDLRAARARARADAAPAGGT